MNPANQFDTETIRAAEDACRFLAACFYEPESTFAEEAIFDSLAAALEHIEPRLAAAARTLGATFAASDPQELLVEYTRLFLGPIQPPAAPYGSLWLGGEPGLMQESTQAVAKLYAEGGFEIDENIHELPDHLAIELEFVYAMLFQARAAGTAGDVASRREWLGLARRLLSEHLGRWIRRFAVAMGDAASVEFYLRLAELAPAVVLRLASDAAAERGAFVPAG